MGEANEGMKRQQPDNIRILCEVLYPLQNQKFELLVPECIPSNSFLFFDCPIMHLKIHSEQVNDLSR